MKPIQLLMDEEVLAELDQTAQSRSTDRSKLIRQAVVHYLRELRTQQLEDQHRVAYEKHPDEPVEVGEWEGVQAWPED